MKHQTVPQAFAAAVAAHGDRAALIHEHDRSVLTYAQVDALRRQAAAALLASGIQPGDRVAIWAQNCVEWALIGLAIHSVGAALVPINTRMKGNEAGYALEKSGARLLFCAGDFLGEHYPSLLGDHRPAGVDEIIVLRDARDGDTDWQQFLQRGDNAEPGAVDRASDAVRADTAMDIMFTSGTTGAPKGVVTTHDQNLKVIAEWFDRMAITEHDRYLVANPFFHAFGYKVGWLGGLLHGCAIAPHAVFDANAVMARIAEDRISVLPGPPTLFISLLNLPADQQYDLSSLRATITGAAAVAPSLIERIRNELGFDIVLTGYGLTETCGIVALCHPDDAAETIVNTCGQPIPEVEVRIVDTENRALAAGETGEIVVRGYNVMTGYLDDPDETAKAIDADGWLHTGDLGFLDDRGYLKITDRLKDMYITGGFNCYPAEIESMMSAHPAIAQVAVIGVADPRMGEVGKAFIVPRHGETPTADDVIAWCRDNMANYKVPRYVETLDALPTNPSGKVMKFKLA